jgi:hypothetical protein
VGVHPYRRSLLADTMQVPSWLYPTERTQPVWPVEAVELFTGRRPLAPSSSLPVTMQVPSWLYRPSAPSRCGRRAVELFAGVSVPHPHRVVVAAGDDAGAIAVVPDRAHQSVAVDLAELAGLPELAEWRTGLLAVRSSQPPVCTARSHPPARAPRRFATPPTGGAGVGIPHPQNPVVAGDTMRVPSWLYQPTPNRCDRRTVELFTGGGIPPRTVRSSLPRRCGCRRGCTRPSAPGPCGRRDGELYAGERPHPHRRVVAAGDDAGAIAVVPTERTQSV